MNAKKMPRVDSIKKLAEFWDTHDLTDFDDQLEEVPETIFERQAVIKIPLPAKEIEAVKKVAKSKGIRYTDLIRKWIKEKVKAS